MNAKIVRDQTHGRIPTYGSVMNESADFTVFAVFIDPLFLSLVNFRLFVVWDKPKNIGRVYFSSKHIVFSVQLIFRIALECMRCLSR